MPDTPVPDTPVPPSNLLARNANATVSGGTTILATGVVWVAGNIFHLSLSAEAGAAIAGGVTVAALWFGRNGVVGLKNFVLYGSGRRNRTR